MKTVKKPTARLVTRSGNDFPVVVRNGKIHLITEDGHQSHETICLKELNHIESCLNKSDVFMVLQEATTRRANTYAEYCKTTGDLKRITKEHAQAKLAYEKADSDRTRAYEVVNKMDTHGHDGKKYGITFTHDQVAVGCKWFTHEQALKYVKLLRRQLSRSK